MRVRTWSLGIALGYGVLLYLWRGITANNMVDGAIGIVIGLYACSHPASYFLNLLFFERGSVPADPGTPTGWSWASFNVLVMIVGWLVVVLGAMQMATRVA